MNDVLKEPEGILITRLFPMPNDINAYGAIFGGWMLSQMDLAGFMLAKDYSPERLVTVAVDQIVFQLPVMVGDLVSFHGFVAKQGRSSIQVNLNVWIKRDDVVELQCVARGLITYVAINKNGKSIPLKIHKALTNINTISYDG